MTPPALSVVMSVYNGEAFLAEAIDSILGQTFHDFEFIIINDGSSDNTAEILSSYAARDSRIRVIAHENKGRATSLNVGIAHAQSNYIARMDADDVALPHRLHEQFQFMAGHTEIGVLGGAVELIAPTGMRISETRPPTKNCEIQQAMQCGNPMWHPTVVLRKDIVLKEGGYRQALLDCDDYDLFLRMGEHGGIANLASVVLRYRIHANQASIKNMRHQAICFLAARAAASFRRAGKKDPLFGVEEVTPQLVASLGVTPEEVQRKLLDFCNYWMHLLKKVDADSALWAIGEFFRLSNSCAVERPILCDAWLAAAGVHYRQGRLARALVCGGRALLTRPIVAGRPVKRAFARLGTAIKG